MAIILETFRNNGDKSIWATTWDFQQCGILKWIDSDEPVQPPFKLRDSKFCSVSSLPVKEYSSDLLGLWSDYPYAQADLHEPLLVAHTTLLEISCHGSFHLTLNSLFACWVIVISWFFSKIISFLKNSFKYIVRVSSSLDPDQARQNVGPDLGPNCLQCFQQLTSGVDKEQF